MKHFDQIKENVIAYFVENKKEKNNYYIIRDVFGKISIFIVGNDSSTEIEKNLKETIGKEWINKIANIRDTDVIFSEISLNSIQIKKRIFYSERPMVKRTWNLSERKPEDNTTKIVTFYSYKGGMGRTTTLVMTALQLARQGKRIFILDFDLEAPGLSTILKPDMEYPKYGVVDYLIEREIYKRKLDIDEYVYPINNKKLLGLNGGEVIVMQSANMQVTNIDEYYNKLSRIDFNMPQYEDKQNVVSNLLEQIKVEYQPDFIFIDSRAGIHDIGGLTVLKYSDEVVPVFYGNEQNMIGLKFILKRIIKFDIPFYLVNSPVPTSEEEAETEINCYLRNSYDILESEEYFNDMPDIFDENSPHYPLNIKYDALVTNLTSVDKIIQVINLNGEDNVYKLLAKKMNTSSEGAVSEDFLDFNNRMNFLESIEKITTEVAAAENEFSDLSSLLNNFYPLKEYRYIFDNNKFLITGAKGSGKTALFNVLKCPEYAHRLAKYVEVKSDLIEQTEWITGLDSRGDFPIQANFRSIGKSENRVNYSVFWKVLMIKVLEKNINEYVNNIPDYISKLFECKYSQIKNIIKHENEIDEKISEFLEELNEVLENNSKLVILTYDALDFCIESDLRSVFISELINLWAEMNIRFNNIKAKIFLREDIYKNEVANITDKIKLNNYRTLINWDYDYLLAMVWKRMIENNNVLKDVLEKQLIKKGYSLIQSDQVGVVPNPNSEINKLILNEIIGEKMGKGNKAYTYNWIAYRLSDTNDNIVPRSILKLFSLSAKNERIDGKNDSIKLITPRSLENSVNEVSEDRVIDMGEEYPEYKKLFSNLKNFCPTFPVEEEILKTGLIQCGISEESLKTNIDKLKEIGILKEYQRKKADPVRYHIPDIYLKGMGLLRKGYR